LDVPIIGLEPAVKPAAKLSKSGIIGVLATQRTINSERLLGLTERYAKNKKVLAQACPGLVEQVESCELNNKATQDLLKKYILPLLDQGTDALILGCTHYPFLLPAIQKITGTKIEILETGKPVAEQLKRILKQNNLDKKNPHKTNNSDYKTNISFYNTSTNKQHHVTMQKLWQNFLQSTPHNSENKIEILTLKN